MSQRYTAETLKQLQQQQQQQMNRLSALQQPTAIGPQLMSLQNRINTGNNSIMNNQMSQSFSPTSMMNVGQGGPSSAQHVILNTITRPNMNQQQNINTNNPQIAQALFQLQQQQQQQLNSSFGIVGNQPSSLFNKRTSPTPPNVLLGQNQNVNLYQQQPRYNPGGMMNMGMNQNVKQEGFTSTPPLPPTTQNPMFIAGMRQGQPPNMSNVPVQDENMRLQREKHLACNPDYRSPFISKQDIFNRLHVFRSLDYEIKVDDKCK
jgi:hypothetical protein